jgi:hypothetical protein
MQRQRKKMAGSQTQTKKENKFKAREAADKKENKYIKFIVWLILIVI